MVVWLVCWLLVVGCWFSPSTSRTSCRTPSPLSSCHLKIVDCNLLRTPHKESMDLSDEFLPLPQVMSPTPTTSRRPQSSPTRSSRTRPPLFSDKVSSADAKYDDAALEGMLREAHRVHSNHSPREDLSVSQSSSVSDRTGRPVGDRTGRPVEQRNQEAQIRTLLDKHKEQILAECQARINRQRISSRLQTEEVY